MGDSRVEWGGDRDVDVASEDERKNEKKGMECSTGLAEDVVGKITWDWVHIPRGESRRFERLEWMPLGLQLAERLLYARFLGSDRRIAR